MAHEKSTKIGKVLDQVAYYAIGPLEEDSILKNLGLVGVEATTDLVTAKSVMRGETTVITAHLKFYYSMGTELEILRYDNGPHFLSSRLETMPWPRPFLSHIGIHLNQDPWPDDPDFVQEVWTISHTNRYLIDHKRTYHYRIYDKRLSVGSFIKYIKRVNDGVEE